MEADDTEVIKKLVETGFGYSILPESALQDSPRFFEIFRVRGRRIFRSQALAMVKSEYPRALTVSIAKFLQSILASGPGVSNLRLLQRRHQQMDDATIENARQPGTLKQRPVSLVRAKP